MTPLESCPWSDWAPGTVEFCEARLCEVIREPANAWSSFAYLIAAAAMISRRQPALVGLAQVLIGVGSFFFHGTGTFAGEMVDQVGMYVLSCLILAYAVGEARGASAQAVAIGWAGMVTASGVINLLVRPIGIPLFAAQLALGLGLQLRRGRGEARYRDLHVGIGIFVVSFGIWALDISRVVCDRDLHWFSGHAVWHVLNAISIGFLGRFYRAGPAAGDPRS